MNTSHGHFRNRRMSPTYQSWHNMKQRCLNPACPRYADYGGRGITVCERWMIFENFLADMGERPEGLTLERTDNDKDYEPGNCVWATREVQSRNRRRYRNAHVYQGHPTTYWAQVWGMHRDSAARKIRRLTAP